MNNTKIIKLESNVLTRILGQVFNLSMLGLGLAGYIWAKNVLWGLGWLNLLGMLLLLAASPRIYRPGTMTKIIDAVSIAIWIVLAAAGWWGLMVLYFVGDILTMGLSASDEEYRAFLESQLD